MPITAAYGIMGILNLTPDSFHDGGKYNSPDAALEQAIKLQGAGAHVIDIGAESTRPGSDPVPAKEELARLAPILPKIRQALPDAILSIDTRNAETAQFALQEGCSIVNDVSGCNHDPQMPALLASCKPGYILTHSKGTPKTMRDNPQYDDIIGEMLRFFERNINSLVGAGLPENRIAIDPGIGFGKLPHHDLTILRNLKRFTIFDRPIVIGLSMKSFIGALWKINGEKRKMATAVLSALLLDKGAIWHRVHDPEIARLALGIAKDLSPNTQ